MTRVLLALLRRRPCLSGVLGRFDNRLHFIFIFAKKITVCIDDEGTVCVQKFTVTVKSCLREVHVENVGRRRTRST